LEIELEKKRPGISAQISWVYTGDLESSAGFYADTLGLRCCRDEGGARLYATSSGAYIGVCETFADRVVEPKGGMISIVTDEVDGWYEYLREKGLEIRQPPQRLEQFQIYSFFVTDPNGYLIEFQRDS
jgi:catechol 2,3-dioxygenase-like lactoylglutathione lyase family enzyme